MAPAAFMDHRENSDDLELTLLETASSEIEQMREGKELACHRSFPPACLSILKEIDGNQHCVDCGKRNPEWAAVSFGALVCLHCSGRHRSLGVNVSCVRSISMDDWSLRELIAMLEGGNGQLKGFFERHALTTEACVSKGKSKMITAENVTKLRYKTKAGLFYRQQMTAHVNTVLEAGPYRGREISRRLKRSGSDRRTVE